MLLTALSGLRRHVVGDAHGVRLSIPRETPAPPELRVADNVEGVMAISTDRPSLVAHAELAPANAQAVSLAKAVRSAPLLARAKPQARST
jgi:hypothetical protein